MKIAIGNDHSAVDMKNEVVEYLKSLGHEVVNFGTDSYESCNYPVYGKAVAEAVRDHNIHILPRPVRFRLYNLDKSYFFLPINRHL